MGGQRGHLLPPFFQDITYNIYKILRQNIALEVFRTGKYHSKAKNSLFFFVTNRSPISSECYGSC